MASQTTHMMFESLFDRSLKPDGAFATDLVAAGYDAKKATPKYPTQVWLDCLEVTRTHRFANLPRDEAYRAIGRAFTDGFQGTIAGNFVLTAVKFFSPLGFVEKLGKFVEMGRSEGGIAWVLSDKRDDHVRLEITNPSTVPGAFFAGIIDFTFAARKLKYTIAVEQKSPTQSVLVIDWSNASS